MKRVENFLPSHAGLVLASLGAIFLLAAGCGGGGDAGNSSSASSSEEAVPPAAMAEAREVFKLRCVSCHGDDGTGNGPASAALNPKPRNYQDAAWQKSITDEEIEKAIVGGGPAVGLSPLMPPNPDLKDKPMVVAGLREIVRGFGE